jgi:hypothetical protein
LSTSDADELAPTAPIELPPTPSPPAAPTPTSEPPIEDGATTAPSSLVDQYVAVPSRPEVVYVPLAATIGDGFKLGCGFFLALVLAMLVGFVVLAALFLLTSAFGLNLPITR